MSSSSAPIITASPAGGASSPAEAAEAASAAANAASAAGHVLLKSERLPDGHPIVKGYDLNKGIDYAAILASYRNVGFQATQFSLACDQIEQMISWRLASEPERIDEDDKRDPHKVKCTIFLGYTSNMISCGVRESLRFLAEHRMIDAIVTTAGGIEEDFMKCLAHHYMHEFKHDGQALRLRGLNRIGNMLVPNLNYCAFEDWINPILDSMLAEQVEKKKVWTPSSMIEKLGLAINHPESVYYWCAKNKIPVFCPALTDGSVGDMLYFHAARSSTPIVLDIVGDIRKLNDLAVSADKSGAIIIGGGIVKHHILNANLMRNGADYAVFVNTGVEYDGSDSGAPPDEAFSWGKVKLTAKPVKLYAEASLVVPLLIAETFAKKHENSPVKSKTEEIHRSATSSSSSSSAVTAAAAAPTQSTSAP